MSILQKKCAIYVSTGKVSHETFFPNAFNEFGEWGKTVKYIHMWSFPFSLVTKSRNCQRQLDKIHVCYPSGVQLYQRLFCIGFGPFKEYFKKFNYLKYFPIHQNPLLTSYQPNEKIKLPFTSLKHIPILKMYLMIFEKIFSF